MTNLDGGLLVVDVAALAQASADISAAVGRLTDSLDRLERDAAPLVATWDGAAKDAYAQRQRRWTTAALDLRTMLEAVKKAIDQSAQDYQQTENRNRALFA